MEEAAIRALANNLGSSRLLSAWLAYRLHALNAPKTVTWKALKAQHGTSYKQAFPLQGAFPGGSCDGHRSLPGRQCRGCRPRRNPETEPSSRYAAPHRHSLDPVSQDAPPGALPGGPPVFMASADWSEIGSGKVQSESIRAPPGEQESIRMPGVAPAACGLPVRHPVHATSGGDTPSPAHPRDPHALRLRRRPTITASRRPGGNCVAVTMNIGPLVLTNIGPPLGV